LPRRFKLDIALSTHAWIRGGERLRQKFEESGEPLDYLWLIQKTKEAIEGGRVVEDDGEVITYRYEDFDFLLAPDRHKMNRYILVTVINKST